MYALIPALVYLPVFIKDTIHGAPVAQVGALIQERGPDLAWRQVHKPL